MVQPFLDYQPGLIGLSSEKPHHTNVGIKENKTFSVNVPSVGIAAADFCGLHSGVTVDKSGVFDVFYGELKTAPMISECPVSIECKLRQTLEFAHGDYFIGELVGVYMEDKYLTDGMPDIRKIDPLLFEGSLGGYWKLEEYVGRVSELGKNYKPKPKQSK